MKCLNAEKAIKELERLGCIWYNPNPTRYCALLVSGKHSNGFINFRRIYETGEGLVILSDIVSNLWLSYYNELAELSVDLVSGTAYGSLIPAYHLAGHLYCGYSWTDKIEDPETGKSKGQVCKTDVLGKRVLLVEDVMTTGGSVLQSRDAIVAAGGSPVGPIMCLVNRSGKSTVNGIPIVSLIDLVFEVYDPADSPWKTAEAIKPKLPGNWEKLVNQA